MNLTSIHKIYFVGIGGIGMSALARYFNRREIAVFGYDKTKTLLTRKLEAEGMTIHYKDQVDLIPENIDLVVFTPAIPSDHQELNYFLKNDYPVKKRAEVLGMISRNQKTIAVAGTHGKTTTTTIVTHLLRKGGIDCTAFLGGIAQNFESNYVHGKSEWLVVEADEYDRSFLQLDPDIAIILSMDADHLDIYGDKDEVKKSFRAFAEKIKEGGQLILNSGWTDEISEKKFSERKRKLTTYGLGKGEYCAKNIRVENGFFVFDFESEVGEISNIVFTLPGHHNVENASAAIAVAQQLGISGVDIKKALASFKGIKRRFETIYRDEKVVYIDDYAHHPSELNAAIDAAKTLFPERKITGIFQPHLYSRTRDFVHGFASALDLLDEIILMDIYPAREKPIAGVTADIIFEKMKNPNKILVSKKQLLQVLDDREIEVLLTMGAGDIDTFIEPIKAKIAHG